MGKKLYGGNLGYNVRSSDLEQLFSQFGEVQSVQVITDRETGRGMASVSSKWGVSPTVMLRSVASTNSSMKAVGKLSAKPNREKRAPQAPREAEGVVLPGPYGGNWRY